MEMKIRARSRFMQVVALLAFLSLVWAYAQLEWGLPQGVRRATLQVRGAIVTEGGAVLARTVDGARKYPHGRLAGQVLGMMGVDGGLEGLEHAYDDQLATGQNVVVTLDPGFQAAAESILAKGVQVHQGEYGSVVVMEVKTGKILAAASYPPFDPAQWRNYPATARRNRPFLDVFEPGSTIKGLVVAAALQDGITTPETLYSTPMRRRIQARWGATINDAVAHPSTLTTQGILRYSSNVGMSHIVEGFSNQRLYDYLSRYGFGQRLALPTVSSATGQLQPVSRWDNVVRTTNSFGQGMSSTTLQLAAAYNSLANDGLYVPPRLVRGEAGGDSREVVTATSARTLRGLLHNVIRDGIFKSAGIKGYDLAGKTGTAQVVVGKSYSNTVYDSVFAGFFPSEQPQVTIAVMVHGARFEYHGSMLAAPIYRDLAATILSKWAALPSE
jgi:cell division protein FtsI (penicillin-binding protein 3)